MSKKIMIVEDEEDIRVYLETLLQENGFETATAFDGLKASDKIKEYNPDLVLLDIIMPNETGVKFYRGLKKSDEYKDIPVVICSGATSYKELFELDRTALPKPFAFVEKPIDRKELLSQVSKALGM